MSRHGDVAREWGDGEYVFRMGLREWRKLDERFDVGPYEFFRRLSTGLWKAEYIREGFRLALQAGGTCNLPNGSPDDKRINLLIGEYVDDRPLLSGALMLADIFAIILAKPRDDQPPKSQAVEGASESFQAEDSPSPPSTDGPSISESPSATSKPSPSTSSPVSRRATKSSPAAKKRSSRQAPMISTP